MFKKLSMKAKMLLEILPLIAIGLIVLTVISVSSSRSVIIEQTRETASSKLEANVDNLNAQLEKFRNTAIVLSKMVATAYDSVDVDSFGTTFIEVIKSNDSILGSGIWFEKKVYRGEEYMGPYWIRNGSGVELTMDYSNAQYNYFEQQYYTGAKALQNNQTFITDPFYDETSGTIMASCSAPIYNSSGEFVGCVSVDMGLDYIEELVGKITMGKTGSALMISSTGAYIYSPDSEKVTSGTKITEDSNTSLAQAGQEVIANADGIAFFKENGTEYGLYYDLVPEVNWRLMIRMAESEVYESVNALMVRMIIICVVALIICAVIILLLVTSISNNIQRVKAFAGSLADGDFTIQKLTSDKLDEIGQMSDSLNNMYESNRSVIGQISNESGQISDASQNLTDMAGNLSTEFVKIKDNIDLVNTAMMSSSAATEELNASIVEITDSIEQLTSETQANLQEAEDIRSKAVDIEKRCQKAYDNAIQIVKERGEELVVATERAQVVHEIHDFADSIANIAEQIDLLSLNASIEAARAGEHGKGFAVVASEINSLASETGESVGRIKDTIDSVQDAFNTLSESSNALLQFLQNTVTPDYGNFVEVGRQYEGDAISFGNRSSKVAQMTESIQGAIDEISRAIDDIVESTQVTAEKSADVAGAVDIVSDVVEGVNDMSSRQNTIAQALGDIVSKFKLS